MGTRGGRMVLCFFAVLAVGARSQQIIDANNPPTWGDSPTLLEEVRIGGIDGPVEYVFGEVDGVLATPTGEIWVGDSQQHLIRRYGQAGEYIGQVGREGKGPGEFMYPSNMRRLHDGGIAVWDPGLFRMNIFTSTGELRTTFQPPTGMVGGAFEELELDPKGHLHLIKAKHLGPGRARLYWLELDEEGEVLDSTFMLPGESEGSQDLIATFSVLSPRGYLVSGRNDEYVLRLHSGEARRVEIHRNWTPVEYQRRERAEKMAREKMFSSRNGRPVRRIGRTKPVFKSLFVDQDGRIWVERYGEGEEQSETPGEEAQRVKVCDFLGMSSAECDEGIEKWRDPLVYDVVSAEGEFQGRVRFPNRRSHLWQASGRTLWVTEQGEYGETYVVRYHIAGS
jgi:hypothetical protein